MLHDPDPHSSPRPALVSYRVALALHPGDTPEPRTPTRPEEDTGMNTLDRTADHHQPPPIHAPRSVGYWLATVLVVAELGLGGIWDIVRIPTSATW